MCACVQRCVAFAVVNLVVVAVCIVAADGRCSRLCRCLFVTIAVADGVAVACCCLESPWPLPLHLGLEAVCDLQGAAQLHILSKIKLYDHFPRAFQMDTTAELRFSHCVVWCARLEHRAFCASMLADCFLVLYFTSESGFKAVEVQRDCNASANMFPRSVNVTDASRLRRTKFDQLRHRFAIPIGTSNYVQRLTIFFFDVSLIAQYAKLPRPSVD